jgi:hypothetical protein
MRRCSWGIKSVSVEEIDSFLIVARAYLRRAYTRIALEALQPDEETEMWRLIEGVEAAIKLRDISLQHQHELVDRELEHQFRQACAGSPTS